MPDAIFYCPHCSLENFYDGQALKARGGDPGLCWSCAAARRLPPRIRIGKSVVMLNFDVRLFPHHVNEQRLYDFSAPAAAIPLLLEGRDVVGQAQTGTGKTAAFALPTLSRLGPVGAGVQALVLTPTRELAIQVAEAFHTYAKHLGGVRVLPVYGGQPIGQQLRRLQSGAQVVVGTPGRVMDHLRRETMDLSGLKTVVLDEADEMLRMGFLEDVEWILEQTPPGRQTALFSATMPREVRRIAERHLRDPAGVEIEHKTLTVPTVEQRYVNVSEGQKPDVLTRLLEAEAGAGEAALIFARTKVGAAELSEKLQARGYAAEAMHGDMSQAQREVVVRRMRGGQVEIVVATDVVGAIANEGGVPGRDIGAIDVHDRFTIVELPSGYAEQVLRRMKGSRIRNYNANIRVVTEHGRGGEQSARSAKKTDGPSAKGGKGKPRTKPRGR
jgi:superfamily II DNA/RNA helicase